MVVSGASTPMTAELLDSSRADGLPLGPGRPTRSSCEKDILLLWLHFTSWFVGVYTCLLQLCRPRS